MSDPQLARTLAPDTGPVEIPSAPHRWWVHVVVLAPAVVAVGLLAVYVGAGAP